MGPSANLRHLSLDVSLDVVSEHFQVIRMWRMYRRTKGPVRQGCERRRQVTGPIPVF